MHTAFTEYTEILNRLVINPRSCQVFLTLFKSITYVKHVRLPVKAGQAVRFFKTDTYYSLRLRRALAAARFNTF